MNKTITSVQEAVASISDGSVLMIGGFGGSGAPIELIHALVDRFIETGSPNNLTVINNNAGNGKIGIAAMITAGMVTKIVCSFPKTTEPHAFINSYTAGEIELELVPQGTLAERIRAAGAGIPAFYTPTSYGTDLAVGKEVKEFEGRHYVMEHWLKADFAIVKAEAGDSYGNLVYRLGSRNFNPIMCMAASETIAQVGEIKPAGKLDPENIHTPGIFVDGVVEVPAAQQEQDLILAGAEYVAEVPHER